MSYTMESQDTYTTVALLYGKKYNLKYWQCIGTGTNGKVTLPNMIAFKKSCTCHVCGYLEENSKQSDQLVCGCDVCNLPLCDHCRATDDENEVVDRSICQDCYDEEDPDRCVKCDRTFDQRKLLNDYDCAWAWDSIVISAMTRVICAALVFKSGKTNVALCVTVESTLFQRR